MKKFEILLLAFILIAAFALRLYKFNAPIADWHSWRQADTSAVSRNFVENGFDLLHPKFEDLSKGVSLLDNPQGYRFVEFPIYNAAQAGLFKYIGHFTLEQWGRLVTIFSALLSIVFLFLLVRRFSNSTAALFAAAFMTFDPYNIYYTRVILSDPSMVMAILGATYFFSLWTARPENKIYDWRFLLSLIFMAAAILLKPYALFFTLPLIFLAFKKFGFSFLKKRQLWFFLVVSLAPFVFWQIWMRQYPQGIPQSGWLFNGTHIRFKGAFFHWLFAQRIGEFILGYFGLPIVILGIIRKLKQSGFFFMFLLSSLIYMLVIATGNVQHDYYQILAIPTIAIFFGLGAQMMVGSLQVFNKYASRITFVICVAFMLGFSWFAIRDFYNIQHSEIITAGKAVESLTPKNAKVIAPYGGDTTLLYATDRNGWPVFDRSLKDFLKQGATVMVFVDPGVAELNFKNYFAVLSEGDKYIAYDLTKPLRPLR